MFVRWAKGENVEKLWLRLQVVAVLAVVAVVAGVVAVVVDI